MNKENRRILLLDLIKIFIGFCVGYMFCAFDAFIKAGII